MSKIKHVAFLNPHGNFDKKDSFSDENPDFRKQEFYVKNLAQALAEMGIQVDIITRQINDSRWPQFSKLYGSYPAYENLRIIRLPFGGDKFLAKEKLWPHLKEYIDAAAEFYDEEGFFPDYFAAHYGDGGLAGVLLKEKIEIPFSFTPHSLAAQKMEALNFNKENSDQLLKKFNFHSRLTAERLALRFADQIIVDSSQMKKYISSHPYYKDTVNNNKNKISIISTGFNKNNSHFIKQKSSTQKNNSINSASTLKSNNNWQDTAQEFLKTVQNSINSIKSIDHHVIPAYYFLPDSDNEHKLMDKFYKKVFKK